MNIDWQDAKELSPLQGRTGAFDGCVGSAAGR
jgi:hypothetical protein